MRGGAGFRLKKPDAEAQQPIHLTNIDVEELRQCWSSNDDVGIVLRTHLELERAMPRLLENRYPKYNALRHDRYSQHIKTVRAIGMEGRLLQIADEINKIRDEMAHAKKGAKGALTQEDLRNLCSQASGLFGGRQNVLDFIVHFGGEPSVQLKDCSLGKQLAAIGLMTAAVIDTITQRHSLDISQ